MQYYAVLLIYMLVSKYPNSSLPKDDSEYLRLGFETGVYTKP